MTASLFRREALDAGRRSRLGGISLAQPLPVWLLTGFAASAAAAIVLLLVFGEYTRRSRVIGQLVPDLGLSTIVAPVAGVVARPLPDEGEQVTRGQAVAVIATSRATTDGGDMTAGMLDRLQQQRQAALRSFAAERQLLELQADGYAAQIAAARLELEQIESATAIQRRRARIAEDLLAHFRQLATQKYATRLQLAQQEQASLEQAAAVQALQRQATALRRDILLLEQGLRELSARESAQAAARDRELADLDRERLRIEAGGEVLVEAPLDGLVASSLGEAGQAVQAGQALLDLLPQGSVLQAQLLVPSRAVGFLDSGDAVLLRYPAFPHQKFGHHRGRVLRISRNARDPRALAALTGDARAVEPIYRVLVELEAQSVLAYGKAQALRPGMVVEADILGERRKLYEWLLEPLYSLSGRL